MTESQEVKLRNKKFAFKPAVPGMPRAADIHGGRLIKCAVTACKRKQAGWFMGFTAWNGEKRFGYVCGPHDRHFGRINLVESGLTLEEAVDFEKEKERKWVNLIH